MYISHKTCDQKVIAKINKDLIDKNRPRGTVCISTCHRLEFYSDTSFILSNELLKLSSNWTSIEGTKMVLQRLAILASGLDSKILGEKFIAIQVRKPFLKTSNSKLPHELIDKTFEIASKVKSLNNFKTEFSYDNFAFDIFFKENIPRPKELIIIGGGLLGQHIARNKLTKEYSSVTIVTNQVKRCSEEIRLIKNKSNLRISKLLDLKKTNSFDCIIATSNINRSYNQKLIKLIEDRSFGSTVDLSAIPIFTNNFKSKFNYYTMYGKEFNLFVKNTNKILLKKKPKVENDIGCMVDNLLN